MIKLNGKTQKVWNTGVVIYSKRCDERVKNQFRNLKIWKLKNEHKKFVVNV